MNIIEKIKELNFPKEHYVVIGSGILDVCSKDCPCYTFNINKCLESDIIPESKNDCDWCAYWNARNMYEK